MEHSQIQPKNAFRLEGSVYAISPLETGMNQYTGEAWQKVNLLLVSENQQYNSRSFYPITFWNKWATNIVAQIKQNDYISVEGPVATRPYKNKQTGEFNYFINLTGHNCEVITKAGADSLPIQQEEVYDDVPF